MKELTNEAKTAMEGWIHDLFIWGGVEKIDNSRRYVRDDTGEILMDQFGNPVRYEYVDESTGEGLMYFSGDMDGKKAAELICHEILYREAFPQKMMELDKALQTLTGFQFWSMDGNTTYEDCCTAALFAAFIAHFCKISDFPWKIGAFSPDGNPAKAKKVTKEEFEEITKFSILGKALWDAECFYFQANDPKNFQQSVPDTNTVGPNDSNTSNTQSSAGATTSASTTISKPANSNQPAKSIAGIKQSKGSLLGNVPNLLSANRETFSAPIFFLQADRATKSDKSGNLVPEVNIPTVFITPIEQMQSVKAGQAKRKQVAEKVKLSSGKGPADCWLYWPTRVEADAFLQKCVDAGLDVKNGKQNLHVVDWTKLDSHGYFKVSTEFGEAYIRAHDLNEALLEVYNDTIIDEPNDSIKELDEIVEMYDRAFNCFD